MELKIFNQNLMRQNVYLYYCGAGKAGCLIDPGHNIEEVYSFADAEGISVESVLLTHGHYDHILHAKSAAERFGAPVVCHADEKPMLESAKLNFSTRVTRSPVSFSPDRLVGDGDELAAGPGLLKVIHTPGHTPGGICFYDEANGALFSGDTLFLESIGRTDFPGSSFAAIKSSILGKLFALPESARVYPGHGVPTTIGHEKLHNELVR